MRANHNSFPVSQIQGRKVVGEEILKEIADHTTSYSGLVSDMSIYEPHLECHDLSPTIKHFYEHTTEYRLFASVKWYRWFKPLAMLYRFFSRRILQINLPLSRKPVEMTGDIISVNEHMDGRLQPRAWVRKVNGEVCFVALYSWHKKGDRTYMNIGLPLPFSTMTGILELNQYGKSLQLSSRKKRTSTADTGTYLSTKNKQFSLPIDEEFFVEQVGEGSLKAQHEMRIFFIPFLTIDYMIRHKVVME
ncbi:hypothetical protein [Pseudalkalibacillus hwajinpoensis]|uniref:hypothetical protein n=1 Tax=Guptibacillus hwajinpoensis TaxID=208199 RepID=UPI001CFE1EA5|nr:hypothetical protein [Pseudalkalibacillus hwajinpoensis]